MANRRIKIVSRNNKEEAPPSKETVYVQLKGRFLRLKLYLHQKKIWILLIPIAGIILIASLWGISQNNDPNKQVSEEASDEANNETALAKVSDVDFYIFQHNDNFYDALKRLKLGRSYIPQIIDRVKDEVPSKNLEGASIRLYSNPSGSNYLIFEPRDRAYNLKITLGDTVTLAKSEKVKESVQEQRAHIVTKDNIYRSLSSARFHSFLIDDLFDLLAWNIDVSRITAENRFKLKVIFNNFVSDGYIDSIRIQAIQLENNAKKLEFYRFKDNLFYDEYGNSAHKMFLKAPIDYKRISSQYGSRIHPIDGFKHAHLGTDYAGPEGTNIRALGDGVVTVAGFTEGNGNYVKIKHDDVYETQYLHMKAFAPNIKRGSEVRQGEVIGYVGSTGKSNGPHVCLRFWKKRKQIDFLNEQIPSAFNLETSNLQEFNLYKDSLKIQLQKIPYL